MYVQHIQVTFKGFGEVMFFNSDEFLDYVTKQKKKLVPTLLL